MCTRTNTTAPTPEQLGESVQHVAYELAALERTFGLLEGGGRFRFESFLLHVRQLREFFWSPPPKDEHENGLHAKHYCSDPMQWTDKQGPLPITLAQTKDRIDRQLAHLARDRHGAFSNLWPRKEMLKSEILAQWKKFLEALPPDRQQEFIAAHASKREELSKAH